MTIILRLLACAALFTAAPLPLIAQTAPPAPPAILAPPPPVTTDYTALRAQSAGLSKADRAQAKQLFATAFTLWQSGNFPAAEIAFKQGLDLDPANAQANYYYGDCLARRKDKAEAKDYLARATALGAGTAEGFEAQAELQQLAAVPTNIADMTQDELNAAFTGKWTLDFFGNKGPLTILGVAGNMLQLTGKDSIPNTLSRSIESGSVHGSTIELEAPAFLLSTGVMTGHLVTPTHIEGTFAGMGSGPWSADKQ